MGPEEMKRLIDTHIEAEMAGDPALAVRAFDRAASHTTCVVARTLAPNRRTLLPPAQAALHRLRTHCAGAGQVPGQDALAGAGTAEHHQPPVPGHGLPQPQGGRLGA